MESQDENKLIKKVTFHQDIYDTLLERKQKYSDAANYCLKILGDK